MIPTSFLVALHITFKRSIKSGLIKVMFLHGMGSGSCLSYTGLVLPEHTNSNTQLLFLNDSQVEATNYIDDSQWVVLSFQLHRWWSHFVALAGQLVCLSQSACLLPRRPTQYFCQRASWQVATNCQQIVSKRKNGVNIFNSISGRWCSSSAIPFHCFALFFFILLQILESC